MKTEVRKDEKRDGFGGVVEAAGFVEDEIYVAL